MADISCSEVFLTEVFWAETERGETEQQIQKQQIILFARIIQRLIAVETVSGGHTFELQCFVSQETIHLCLQRPYAMIRARIQILHYVNVGN